MEKLKIHILCDFDAQIQFFDKKEKIFCIDTVNSLSEFVDIVVSEPKNFITKIYPIQKKGNTLVSYSSQFFIENEKFFSNSGYVDIFTLPKDHYIIYFKAVKVENKNQLLLSDKVEIDGGKIKSLKELPTLTKRGKISVYEKNKGMLELSEEYFVNLKEEKSAYRNEPLLLLSFFENIWFKDYYEAKNFLTDELSEKLSPQIMKKFFGDVSRVFLVNFYENPSVVTIYEKTKTAKSFSANYISNLISDIYQDE